MRGEGVIKGAFVFFMGVVMGGIGLKYYARTPEQVMEPVAQSELKYIKEKLQAFADTDLQSYLNEKNQSLRMKKADIVAQKTVQILANDAGINIPGSEALLSAASSKDTEQLETYKKLPRTHEADSASAGEADEEKVLTRDEAKKMALERAKKDKIDPKELDKMGLIIDEDSTIINFMWAPKDDKRNWEYSVTIDKHTKEISSVIGTIAPPPSDK